MISEKSISTVTLQLAINHYIYNELNPRVQKSIDDVDTGTTVRVTTKVSETASSEGIAKKLVNAFYNAIQLRQPKETSIPVLHTPTIAIYTTEANGNLFVWLSAQVTYK